MYSLEYNEDDYCLIEFVDATSKDEFNLSYDYKFDFEDINNLLISESFFSTTNIYSCYSNNKSKLKNSIAYAFENYFVVIIKKNNTVIKIWLVYNRISDDYSNRLPKLKNLIMIMGNNFNLKLMDHIEYLIVNLKNKNEVEQYVNDML